MRTCAVAAVMSMLLISANASAQTDTTKKLKEVTVKSSLIPQVQGVVPAQRIQAADFAKYSAFNVADVVRGFSGVILKDYGGIGGLKTISVRGLSANHTAVLYDGIQVNDAENGQVDLSKLNLNNIQDITLYIGQPAEICMPARSFASSSVLAITTVKPMLTSAKPYHVTAGVKAGSFGLINPYLQWQQRITERWSFIANGYTENANGRYKYKTADHPDSLRTRNNGDIAAQQADGALYWTKNDSNKFNLRVNYYNADRGIPGAVVLYNPTVSRARLWNKDFFSQAGYEKRFDNRLHLLVNAKFSRNFLRYADPDFLNSNGG
ncbi:MAG TPA: TonB-dependent receptor, partial [Mucilaginibacter sp.]